MTANQKVVSSSLTVGNNCFHFPPILRGSTEHIQWKSSIAFILGNRCIGRKIILNKMAPKLNIIKLFLDLTVSVISNRQCKFLYCILQSTGTSHPFFVFSRNRTPLSYSGIRTYDVRLTPYKCRSYVSTKKSVRKCYVIENFGGAFVLSLTFHFLMVWRLLSWN